MDSNTSSLEGQAQPPHPTAEPPDDLAALTAALDRLATRDRRGLPPAVRAQRVLALRRLADRLEGQWLMELAEVDAAGAPAPSTASWLRHRATPPRPAPSAPPGRCSGAR